MCYDCFWERYGGVYGRLASESGRWAAGSDLVLVAGSHLPNAWFYWWSSTQWVLIYLNNTLCMVINCVFDCFFTFSNQF